MRLGRFPLFARAQGAPPQPPIDGEPPPEDADAPAPPPPPPLTPAAAHRERRELVRRREIELRDVGGLAVEMIRRDRWNPELLVSRCGDVLAVEQRIYDLDSYLAAAEATPSSMRSATVCRCGAPLIRGAHFCSHCGRPAADTPPVVACAHCGNPLPAEANFCSFCGNPAGDELAPTESVPGDETTAVHRFEDDR